MFRLVKIWNVQVYWFHYLRWLQFSHCSCHSTILRQPMIRVLVVLKCFMLFYVLQWLYCMNIRWLWVSSSTLHYNLILKGEYFFSFFSFLRFCQRCKPIQSYSFATVDIVSRVKRSWLNLSWKKEDTLRFLPPVLFGSSIFRV